MISHLFTKIKKTTMILLLLLLSFTLPVQADTTEETFSIQAKAALAVDVATGTILYEQNSNARLPMASITKLLSFYVIQDHIATGEFSWSDSITISKEISDLSYNLALSNVLLETGDTYTIEELFETAVLQSANAATVAIAETIAGTEKDFVDLMKQQLSTWGITDSKIVNSTGLNNEDIQTAHYPGSSPTDENELSARDIAIVARHLIVDFPETLAFTKKASATFHSKSGGPAVMYSTNWLLPGMPYEKASVDGLKTGTTDLAGPSFVGSAIQNNQRIITVILNAEADEEHPDARFTETSRLIDYAYENWQSQSLLTAGEPLPSKSTVPVVDGKEKNVPIVSKDSLNVLLPTKTTLEDFDVQLTLEEKNQKSKAPISKGQELGAYTLIPKEPLLYLETSDEAQAKEQLTALPFYAEKDVEKTNIFVRIWRKLFD
ncbi:serine hydrolase [Enterococcus sp. LJL98]